MSWEDTVLIPVQSFHIDLAALDACHPIHYSRRLLVFRCASSAQRDTQLTALKSGLQALVLRCPLLGGKIVPLPPEEAGTSQPEWRTVIPDRGLELVVRDLRSAMPSFEELDQEDFPSSKLSYDLLVPVPQDINNECPFNACKVQFSSINGGTVLTWAMSHSLADGSGTNELLRVLSEATRFAQECPGDDAPRYSALGMDRTVMRNVTSNIPFTIEDHPGYRLKSCPPVDIPSLSFAATSPEIPVLLRISPESLVRLKADATTPNSPSISTHDAISALVWRSVLLIRSQRSQVAKDLPASTIGSIFMPSDARRHLNLPQAYVGNAVYQLTAELELGTLFSSSGLQHAAAALRHAISAVTPSLVSSLMAMTNEMWLDWAFLSSYSTTGVAMGTDWTSSSLYNDDWGNAFGPLVRYRYPNEPFNCVMPKLSNGSAEVIVSVMSKEVEMLKSTQCFGKYIETE